MFSDEQEIIERLNSERNLLNQLSLDEPSSDETKSNEEEKSEEISDEAALSLLDSALNGKKIGAGRPKGQKVKTNDERSDAVMFSAVMGHTLGAEFSGVSRQQTYHYIHGRTYDGQESGSNKELVIAIKDKLSAIQDKAANKLNCVLDVVDEVSFESLREKPEAATRVGMNLARIIEKTMPKEQEERNTTQFIIMQPPLKSLKDYEVIDV